MPLPLGHSAIALAIYETKRSASASHTRWPHFLAVTFLANLPDLDILAGLIFQHNGAVFHRGPTHSILFAVAAGFLASRLWRLRPWIPRLSAGLCICLILSHVIADMLLTSSPVSLFWPLELYWSQGHSSWGQVIDMALFQSLQDLGIAAAALIYVVLLRIFRSAAQGHWVFSFAAKRAKQRP